MQAMQAFATERTQDTVDELWIVEHEPVYTVGLKLSSRSFTPIAGIPVVNTDRGGDITYHGPGQVVVYLMIDLARRRLGIKALVRTIEQAVLNLLAHYGVTAERRPGAPGVYVGAAKIAALGLRVRNGTTYHGVALNVDMDLDPFRVIDPCGYPGLAVTQLGEWAVAPDVWSVGDALVDELKKLLGYNAASKSGSGDTQTRPTKVHG